MFDISLEVPAGATIEEFKVFAEEKFNTYFVGKNATYSFVDANYCSCQDWDIITYQLARKAAIK